jgi:hypothetical protein
MVPTAIAPFKVTFSAPPGYHHAVLSFTSGSTSVAPVAGLTLTMGARSIDGQNRLHVPGTIRNTNGFRVDTTRVTVLLYDSRAYVINAVRVAPSATTLGPGASASFDTVFADHYDTWRLVARRAMAFR